MPEEIEQASVPAIQQDNNQDTTVRRKVGKWKLEELLGEGSSASVYLAEDTQTGYAGAVKVVDIEKLGAKYKNVWSPDTIVDLLYQEALIMAEMSHKNIVKVYEAFVSKKHFYICMEYIVGVSGVDIIPSGGLSERSAIKIVWQILSAVEFFHSRDVVHGDVKLDNIMIDPKTGCVKLVDFGFARRVQSGKTVKAIGWTRIYAPPEGHRTGRISKAWDIWSCGISLYILLTGYFPFGNNIHDWTSGQTPEIMIPRNLSEECVELLLAMLQIAPERRVTATEAKSMKVFRKWAS